MRKSNLTSYERSLENNMSQLVQKLAKGEHPVEVTLRPERSVKALKQSIDRGYVHIKFTDTQGGTELGVRLDMNTSDLAADFDKGAGKVKLVGNLVLDYQKVQCIAQIDIASLAGTGHLIVL
jgi:hypothetical protein